MIARTILRAVWLVPASVLIMGGLAMADPEVGAQQVADTTGVELPTLSTADLAEADSIINLLNTNVLNLNSVVTTLLTSTGLTTILEQGPWHSAKDYRLLGVSRVVKLPTPLDLGPVVLPDVQYDLSSDTYQPFLFKYDSITGLSEVRILIDLTTDLVVAITPVEAASITPSSDNTFPEVTDGGLG